MKTEEMVKGDRALAIVNTDQLEIIIENQTLIMDLLLSMHHKTDQWLVSQMTSRVDDLRRRNQILAMRKHANADR